MNRRSTACCCFLFVTTPFLALAQVQVNQLDSPPGTEMTNFGTDFAVDGERLLAGTAVELAYLYRRTMNGLELEREFTSPTAQAFAGFANNVALQGEWAVFSAHNEDTFGTGAGAVHVYRLADGNWTFYQTLSPAAPKPGDRFGSSIALDAGRLVVGAPGDPDGGDEAGNAYVFEFVGFGWLQLAELAITPVGDANYGSAVAIHGDLAVVGARGDETAGMATGAAHVWHRTPTGWGHGSKLTSASGGGLHAFGSDLDTDGTRIAIAAPTDNSNGNLAGSLYVFAADGGGFRLEQKLLGAPGSLFGKSVQVVGDRLWCGAIFGDGAAAGAGHVVQFDRTLGIWEATRELSAGDGALNDFFGGRIALEGSKLWVAAPLHVTSVAYGGALYEFDLDQFWTAYCGCEAQAPCGNDTPTGGCTNSTGAAALLTITGSASVSADDLVLGVSDVPAGTFGVFCAGRLRGASVLGDGFLCLDPAAGLRRFPVQLSGNGGTFVQASVVAASQAWGDDAIDAGTSWNMQCWFRDNSGPCGQGSNLSNAVDVAFTF